MKIDQRVRAQKNVDEVKGAADALALLLSVDPSSWSDEDREAILAHAKFMEKAGCQLRRAVQR